MKFPAGSRIPRSTTDGVSAAATAVTGVPTSSRWPRGLSRLTTGGGLRAIPSHAWAGVRAFVAEQPQWVVLGFLYCLVWYTPMPSNLANGDGPLAWCWPFWKDMNQPLGFQLFVPVAVGLLIWSKRAALRAQWNHVTAYYPEHHPKREGNLLPLAVGAFLVIFSHFVEVKGFGVVAAIVVAFGTVYRIYGSVITRMLMAPFAVFLLMIPPPDSFIDLTCVAKTLNAELKVATVLMNLLHIHTVNAGSYLEVNGLPVPLPLAVSRHVSSGLSVVLASAFVSLVYCLYRRAAPTTTLWMVLLSLPIAFALNLIRVIAIGITFTPFLPLANLLASPLAAWIEAGAAFGLSWLAMRARIKAITVKINTPLSVHHAVRMAGTGIETMALPLIGAGKVMQMIGAGWTWSEQRLERLLKSLTPKRKRRRSSSSSSSKGRRK